MDSTESGMATEARDVQPANADPPMDLTESGMATEARDVHP